MRKYTILSFIFGLLFVGSFSIAGITPGSGIEKTSHDLSSGGVGALYVGAGTTDSMDRICIYCHSPHHTISVAAPGFERISYYPLWNHGLSTIATFFTYTNGSNTPGSLPHQFNGQDTMLQPGSTSMLCLSCHDGSIAISAYGYVPAGNTGSRQGTRATGRILIGGGTGDLRNHHPIGFYYDDVAAKDDEINPSDTPLRGANTHGLTIKDLLWNGRMECSTCHDVHNTKNEGPKFTWVRDERSDFCATCHRKL